jgi:hypothetical protein
MTTTTLEELCQQAEEGGSLEAAYHSVRLPTSPAVS